MLKLNNALETISYSLKICKVYLLCKDYCKRFKGKSVFSNYTIFDILRKLHLPLKTRCKSNQHYALNMSVDHSEILNTFYDIIKNIPQGLPVIW